MKKTLQNYSLKLKEGSKNGIIIRFVCIKHVATGNWPYLKIFSIDRYVYIP